MLQVLSIIFPIFAIVLVGYLYARRHGPDMASANRLNLDVFTPALIFSVLSAEGFDLQAYANLALAAMVVVLGSGLLAWPLARVLGWNSSAFVPPMMFNNSGNMGLPLALFAFGEAALPAAMVLFLVENTLHFTVGNAILIRRINPLALLRMPMLVATLAGIGVSLLQLSIPQPLHNAIELLGQIAIPLMLFSLGVRMTGATLKDWRIGLVGAIACPATGLLAAWLAVIWIGLSETDVAQLLIFAALPPAVLNYMLAERYNIRPQQVASIVLLGNLASVVVIPVVLFQVL